ncbi:hypothetical protein A2303_01870 [Candidatus Falkowbacteria bacterium RIFOXYB2_FULL_47_14]|uniref:Glycosyl transferase family 1 domain-containing protein n=1 Tax=Candidatus Falkowbacteria bacterium RIFOXYA2_FULL_47_19 TaxID=1797994 RepID=A0A1F5SNB5_9BACT|nr:MAG: hypothetical protein A2227_06820 [Candidatus Falkowbacteria bacterium RIFOXYA2_FULL_47_19]OGF34583.1 MAG: hypothetical protein A2468_07770 [Candidatus Falkowbacteria bacterium RIFOXYC2_FULL_46_15]OGF43201.1 MAG: hypothetical protein A2303_01870 [Candidatus Falkowbacteria bacterium RIFOXYB2_FULL_47_14]
MNAKKKLVILSVNYEPYMSGAEQMVREILERLGEKYATTLLTARFDKKLPFYEKRAGFEIFRLGIGHKIADKFLYPVLAAMKARDLNADIIHAVMESYAGGALVLVKYFCPRAKRILTLQSGDLDDDRKQNNPLIRFTWKIIHRSPHIVTAISSFLAHRAERLGVKPENIFITPNGVDLSEVPTEPDRVPGRVLCMGRLSWEKGYDYLIPAWPEVVKAAPEARLVIYGDGPREKEIRGMVRESGVEEKIEIRRPVPHAEFMKEMAKAEVFILPTLAEGLGIVFIEAQACGVPPIGTRVGGVPDVIQDGENGLLIEPKNSDQIAEAILRLLKDRPLRDRLRAGGLLACRRFEWKEILGKIDDIYKDVLK